MRDKDNKFGTLLIQLREKHNVTLEQLCEGICTPSMLNKIEKGERIPDAMTQNCFMDRLGISRESNGSFVFYDDYDDWNKRWAIIDSIEDEDGREAELLEDYYKNNAKDSKVKLQFYLVMKVQMLIHRRLKLKEPDIKLTKQIEELYEQALKTTVPNADTKSIHELKLSVEELNIFLEYESIILSREENEFVSSENAAECIFNRYQELITYIDNAPYNLPSRAKIYPKTVVYMYRQLEKYLKPQSESGMNLYNRLFKLFNIALEILRDDGTAYYMCDVLEIRKRILDVIINDMRMADKQNAVNTMEGILAQNEEWYSALCKVYEDYGVSKEWVDSCYLYKEQDVQCIGDVIRTRRRMLGMSRKELYEGICSDKTLDRLEANKTKGHRAIVTELIDRLNLSLDFQQLEVISDSREMIELYHQMKRYVNNSMYDEADKAIKVLRKGLPKHMINEQLLHRDEIVIDWRKGRISDEEYIEGLRRGLEHTVSLKDIYDTKEKIYLSNAEASYVYSISLAHKRFKRYDEAYQYIIVLYEIYKKCRDDGNAKKYISMYEYVMRYVGSLMGDMGGYEESNSLEKTTINECLKLGRLKAVHICIYNILYNIKEEKKDQDTYKKGLYQCICLSQLSKDIGYEKAYKERYEE